MKLLIMILIAVIVGFAMQSGLWGIATFFMLLFLRFMIAMLILAGAVGILAALAGKNRV